MGRFRTSCRVQLEWRCMNGKMGSLVCPASKEVCTRCLEDSVCTASFNSRARMPQQSCHLAHDICGVIALGRPKGRGRAGRCQRRQWYERRRQHEAVISCGGSWQCATRRRGRLLGHGQEFQVPMAEEGLMLCNSPQSRRWATKARLLLVLNKAMTLSCVT